MRTRAVLAVCAAGAFLASVQPALAGTRGQIRVGAAPRPSAGSKVLGSLGSGTPIGVTVALKPRDPAALAAYAAAVATPGSGVYHEYLTPAQFAHRFGPTGTQIAAVESSLRAHGLNPGAVSANGLAIRVAATAGAVSNAFSTSFQRVGVPGGRTAYVNTAAPAVNANVAGDVQGVIGLDTLSVPQPLALRHSASRSRSVGRRAPAPRATAGEPQACPAATGAAPGYRALTAAQLSSAYDFSGFYGAGDFGAGQTVAIYELEGNFHSDIAGYQACYGTSTSVTYQPVDGGAPAPAQGAGLESALDIEDLIGLAPQANVIVYQGPNSDSVASGPYDTYNTIISEDKAQVISTSWGQCEALTSPATASSQSQLEAENTLFQEAATQGQTILAASGDSGSADCQPSGGSTGLAVDDPASQPFVTGVGGTTVTALGPPPSETAWNDGAHGGGGGGGISTQWPMPAYQSSAAPGLNVINSNSSPSPCGSSAGTQCRQVPDVSADAGGASSYLVYYGGWIGVYGTSGAAPTWASLIALANASSACTGSPIGFANPGLYRAAGSSATAIFNDITVDNNDSQNAHSGLFAAGPGYDMATGLGTPIGAALPAALCAGTGFNPGAQPTPVTTFTPLPVAITSPGNQTGIVGKSLRLQVHAVNSGGAQPYAARGLPRGLSINASTGLITGTPTTAGGSTVTLQAAASGGARAVTSFRWQINVAASVSHASLSAVGQGKPGLSLTVIAAAGAPSLKTIMIGLPPGWGFSTRSRHRLNAVVLTGPGGGRLKFAAQVTHGVLRVTLAGSSSTVRVTISALMLTVTKSLARKAAHHHLGPISVLIDATNSSHTTTRTHLKLPV